MACTLVYLTHSCRFVNRCTSFIDISEGRSKVNLNLIIYFIFMSDKREGAPADISDEEDLESRPTLDPEEPGPLMGDQEQYCEEIVRDQTVI